MDKQIRILTFGKFQISDDDSVYTDATNSKGKIWNVLKYLIVFSGKPVSADTLIDELWSEEDYDDPAKVLRDTIYRLRKTLASFFGERPYVLFSQGNYIWNPEIDCLIDFIEFDKLLESACADSKSLEERTELYHAAIDLYNGPFLGNSAVEIWTLRFTDYYRRRFLQAVDELAELYEAESMLDELMTLYGKALACAPYEEALYVKQIQALIHNGEYARARQQYRVFEKILIREFGAKPSNNLERLSYEIDRATATQTGSFEEITQLLESENKKHKAVFCGPETFRQIYVLDKRSDERVSFPVFLVLITYAAHSGVIEDMNEADLKAAMKSLRQILIKSLREGDVISQYSKCQFILMLTVSNNDGGKAALRRIKFLFEQSFGKDRGGI